MKKINQLFSYFQKTIFYELIELRVGNNYTGNGKKTKQKKRISDKISEVLNYKLLENEENSGQ